MKIRAGDCSITPQSKVDLVNSVAELLDQIDSGRWTRAGYYANTGLLALERKRTRGLAIPVFEGLEGVELATLQTAKCVASMMLASHMEDIQLFHARYR
jgi:hypothetical protein